MSFRKQVLLRVKAEQPVDREEVIVQKIGRM